MRVLLNFLPLLGRGGGRQNALNLWATLARHEGAGHRWLALARDNLGLEAQPAGSGMELETLAVEGRGVGGGRFRAENVDLPRLAARFGADVIFTPMGTGPVRSSRPRVVGWHDSTAVYPESPMWVGHPARALAQERARAAYAAVVLHGAARVCVQTATMGRRVSAALGVASERIRVVPNGLSAVLAGGADAGTDRAWAGDGAGARRILVVTTTQPAKNLVAVPRIARALADLGVDGVEILVTVDPAEGAKEMGVGWSPGGDLVVPGSVRVRCVGSVPHHELAALYRSGSAVLVPSWTESFTAVYPEAWHFGLPVVTSDLDFARELCGDAALYAPPDRPGVFAAQLLRALDHTTLRAELARSGRQRLAALPNWDERLSLYLAALEEARAMG